jgi:hypothetical protein
MRKMCLVLLCTLFLHCSYNAYQYRGGGMGVFERLNDQIGDVIDAEEREEYDLFRGVEDFESATLFVFPDGGFRAQIVTKNKELVYMTRSPMAIEILREYVERYGEIKVNRGAFEKRWGIVAYDKCGQPITRAELKKFGNPAKNNCGYGCCMLGYLTTGLIGIYIFKPEGDAYNVVSTLCGAPGGLFGLGAGVYIGEGIDRTQAIKAIREARGPREVGE